LGLTATKINKLLKKFNFAQILSLYAFDHITYNPHRLLVGPDSRYAESGPKSFQKICLQFHSYVTYTAYLCFDFMAFGNEQNKYHSDSILYQCCMGNLISPYRQ
jgi:hypothetical protein